jgi:uncharacterized protein YggT (Ycf19 family)
MIRILLRIYIVLLVLSFLVDLLPQFKEHPWVGQLKKITDAVTRPIKRFLPPDLPLDFSPLIAAFLIEIFIRIF